MSEYASVWFEISGKSGVGLRFLISRKLQVVLRLLVWAPHSEWGVTERTGVGGGTRLPSQPLLVGGLKCILVALVSISVPPSSWRTPWVSCSRWPIAAPEYQSS